SSCLLRGHVIRDGPRQRSAPSSIEEIRPRSSDKVRNRQVVNAVIGVQRLRTGLTQLPERVQPLCVSLFKTLVSTCVTSIDCSDRRRQRLSRIQLSTSGSRGQPRREWTP